MLGSSLGQGPEEVGSDVTSQRKGFWWVNCTIDMLLFYMWFVSLRQGYFFKNQYKRQLQKWLGCYPKNPITN